MTKKFLTQNQRKEIQNLSDLGFSTRNIANELGCSQRASWVWKNRNYTHRKKHNIQKRISYHEDLIKELYMRYQSSIKVRDILLKKGIKINNKTILSRIPLEIRKKNRRRTKNNPYLNTGIKASELDKDLISGLYLKYKSGMRVKLELEKQGIKASLSTIYKVIPKELKNKSKKK